MDYHLVFIHPCEHTPSVHGAKNGESDIFPDFYPRTELYSEPFLRSFIYLYFTSSYGHFPFNDSERVVMFMYFYLLHAYCDFIALTDFKIYE